MLNVFFWHWETEKCQHNNKIFIFNDSDWLFMSICATRAHLWPQNLTEMIQICLIFEVKLPKHLTTSKELSLIEPIPGTHWAQLNSLGNQFLCWQRSRSGKTIGAMDWLVVIKGWQVKYVSYCLLSLMVEFLMMRKKFLWHLVPNHV